MTQWSAGLLPAPLNSDPGMKQLEQAVNARPAYDPSTGEQGVTDVTYPIGYIRRYGARPDASPAVNIAAINAAVTAVNALGGGAVVADFGTFATSSHVIMKTGVFLMIGPNAQIRRTDTSAALAVYFGAGVTNAGIGGPGIVYGPDVATSINDGSVIVFEGCDSCYTTPGLQVQGGKVAGIALLSASTNCTIDRSVHTLLNVAANQSDNADIYIRYGQSGHRILYPKCLSTTKRGGIGIQPLADGLDITDITIVGAEIRSCTNTNGHGVFGYVGVGGGWLRRIRVLDCVIEDTDNIGVYFIGQLSGIDDIRVERITLRRNVKVGTAGTLMDAVVALSTVTNGRVHDIMFEGTSGASYVNPAYGVRLVACDGVEVSRIKGRFLKGMAIGVWADSACTNCEFDAITLTGQVASTAFRIEGTGHTVGTLTAREFANGLTTGTTTDLIVQRLVTRTITNNTVNVNALSTSTKILSHDSDGTGTVADAGTNTRLPMGSATTDTTGLLKIVQQLQLSGAAPSITRLLLGSSSDVSSVSTSWSGGDLILAQNAYPNLGSDSWHQALGASPSRCLRLQLNGSFYLYAAAAGTADGTFATFWGTAQVQLNLGGSAGLLFNGTQVVGARSAAVATVAAPSVGYVQAEAQAAATAINALIARLQAHGLIS